MAKCLQFRCVRCELCHNDKNGTFMSIIQHSVTFNNNIKTDLFSKLTSTGSWNQLVGLRKAGLGTPGAFSQSGRFGDAEGFQSGRFAVDQCGAVVLKPPYH